MRRVVLDTNVLVSGLGWSGPPSAIVEYVLAGEVILLTSAPLLVELRRVLRYPKLARVFTDPDGICELVQAVCVEVEPEVRLTVVADDSDNRILEAAVEGGAGYIVSGDDHLLYLGSFQGIPILTPTAFVSAQGT